MKQEFSGYDMKEQSLSYSTKEEPCQNRKMQQQQKYPLPPPPETDAVSEVSSTEAAESIMYLRQILNTYAKVNIYIRKPFPARE